MTDGERRWLIVLVAAYLGATVAFPVEVGTRITLKNG
jgi:hypothetical protein